MNSEHERLRDIEKQYARIPSNMEAVEVREEIIKGTLPAVPDKSSPEFDQSSLDTYKTDDDLGNQLGQILGPGENVYIMSEEESEGPYGLTQFKLDDLKKRVVPYLREWGQLTNYWVINPETRHVVTFDKSGIVFWRKKANEPQTITQQRQN
jgi:hypothetical protein